MSTGRIYDSLYRKEESKWEKKNSSSSNILLTIWNADMYTYFSSEWMVGTEKADMESLSHVLCDKVWRESLDPVAIRTPEFAASLPVPYLPVGSFPILWIRKTWWGREWSAPKYSFCKLYGSMVIRRCIEIASEYRRAKCHSRRWVAYVLSQRFRIASKVLNAKDLAFQSNCSLRLH